MSQLELVAILEKSQLLGYIGPGSINEHLEHARAQLRAASPTSDSRWCDLGAGGGLPGLVIAYDRPDLNMVLLDRSITRTDFLERAVRGLGLQEHVEVLHGDAAAIAHQDVHRGAYDGVLSRSFGSPATTAECASGLLRVGGRLVASEPPRQCQQRWHPHALNSMGFSEPNFLDGPPRFVSISLLRAPSSGLPRKWTRIRKDPMF
ncbi:uncharacterized protein METZ01_LOCUS18197 [marine metagenome]|uniref:Glucose-inhibited division protein B n=1 Tax=marine metagenome TaxID=408172 RepID=A0A381PIT3_9ZZZZ